MSIIILTIQMRKSATSAADIYQASSVCWVLYCAIPYVIQIFKAFYLCIWVFIFISDMRKLTLKDQVAYSK